MHEHEQEHEHVHHMNMNTDTDIDTDRDKNMDRDVITPSLLHCQAKCDIGAWSKFCHVVPGKPQTTL
jgi:hypothetical protein